MIFETPTDIKAVFRFEIYFNIFIDYLSYNMSSDH